MAYADQVTSFWDLWGMELAVRASLGVRFSDRKRTEHGAWQRRPGTSITPDEPTAVVWSVDEHCYPTRAASARPLTGTFSTLKV